MLAATSSGHARKGSISSPTRLSLAADPAHRRCQRPRRVTDPRRPGSKERVASPSISCIPEGPSRWECHDMDAMWLPDAQALQQCIRRRAQPTLHLVKTSRALRLPSTSATLPQPSQPRRDKSFRALPRPPAPSRAVFGDLSSVARVEPDRPLLSSTVWLPSIVDGHTVTDEYSTRKHTPDAPPALLILAQRSFPEPRSPPALSAFGCAPHYSNGKHRETQDISTCRSIMYKFACIHAL